MDLQEPTSIKEMFQSLIPDALSVFQARVISVSPLTVQAVNDEKLILNKNVLSLPRHLSDYTATCDISGGSVNGPTSDGAHLLSFTLTGATMKIHNALKPGEMVYVLSFNGGKAYYILDRVT